MKSSDYTLISREATHWIMHVPVVSTGHMHKSDDEKLQTESHATDNGPVVGLFGGLGYLLNIDDLGEWSDEGYSDAFLHLIETFHHLGFHYLRIDPDGDRLDDLPQFKW